MKKFEVYAHRGGCYPPNTLLAFLFSSHIGAEGIETDICLTTDGEPIIYHPETLDPDPIRLSWKSVNKSYGFIPHLNDFLAFLACHPKLKCLLDVKQNSHLLIEKVVDEIEKDEFRKRIFLTTPKKQSRLANFSVDASLLEYARKLDGRLKIHIIDTLPLDMSGTVRKHRADMISFGWLNDSLASQALFGLIFKTGLRNASLEVEKVQNAGAKVMAGIVNTAEEIKGLITLCPSLDAIMTDNPAMALSIRESSLSV